MGEQVGAGHVEETELDAIPVVLQSPRVHQMSPGSMRGTKDFAVFDGLACFQEEWSRRVFGQGVVPDGFFLFACVSPKTAPLEWCGRKIDRGHMGFGAPGAEVGFWSSEPGSHVVLLVPEPIITAYQEAAPSRRVLSGSGTITSDPEDIRRFVERIDEIVAGCLMLPSQLDDGRTRSLLRNDALHVVMRCLDDASMADRLSKQERGVALRRAIEHAESVRGLTTVPELASAAGLAVRTLELAFREGPGVSPNQYLRRRRMNEVRRELRDAAAGSTTVTRVATAWGFTELGRFAAEYRKMFGELPSETLASQRLVRPRVTPLSLAVRNPSPSLADR